jgi:hypothetical protein
MDCLRQEARTADDATTETSRAIPYELKVADPVASGNILRLARRAPDGCAKNSIDARRKRSEERGECQIILELKDAVSTGALRFAGASRCDPAIPLYSDPKACTSAN